jgi:pimeloyl-ACP methyl ester carboxylesterase
MMEMEARLHDGTRLPVVARGAGPAVLLPVRPEAHEEPRATQMRQWGADPDLGPRLIAGLAADFRVVAADYEGHRERHPAPATLTPDAVAHDLLAIADAAGAGSFAYYGYSWLALSGLQLALRTDRLWALAMGGYPPADGPYPEMLAVTRAAHELALAQEAAGAAPSDEAVEPGDWSTVRVEVPPARTQQYVTLYEALRGFDDTAAQRRLSVPRLCFAGADDDIAYGPGWGEVTVRIAEPLARRRAALEADGWTVELLAGLDHLGAMRVEVVLPLLRSWLAHVASAAERA